MMNGRDIEDVHKYASSSFNSLPCYEQPLPALHSADYDDDDDDDLKSWLCSSLSPCLQI